MSIEQGTPQPNEMRNANGEIIRQTTLVDGTTRALTQAEFEQLDAEGQIPHSGVHHGEKPVNDYDNTTLREAADRGYLEIPSSPEALQVAAPTKKERKKLSTFKKFAIGVTALSAVGSAGVAFKVMGMANDLDSAQPPEREPGVSAPAVPGEVENPDLEVYNDPGLFMAESLDGYTDPTYEELKSSPASLSQEQLSDWNSSDIDLQNAVASDVIAPRLQAAIWDMWNARRDGMGYDISYLTTDPAIEEQLLDITNYYDRVSEALDTDETETGYFEVCRTNSYYEPEFSVCADARNTTGDTTNFSPLGGDIVILTARGTTTDAGFEQKADQQDDGTFLANAKINRIEGQIIELDGQLLISSY